MCIAQTIDGYPSWLHTASSGAGGRKPVAGPWPSCRSFHPVTRLEILSQDTGSRCLVREMDINQSTAVLESTLAASWDARAEPASCSLVLTLGKIINFAMPGVSASLEQRLLKCLSQGGSEDEAN